MPRRTWQSQAFRANYDIDIPNDIDPTNDIDGDVDTATAAGGTVTGGVCAGWSPDTPQPVMTLNGTFTGLWLALDTDTAMLSVTYEASTFCSDTEGGVHVLERGSWSRGDYDIHVGVAEEGTTVDYVLTVTEGGSRDSSPYIPCP